MSPRHATKLKLKPSSKYISHGTKVEEVLSLGGPEDETTLVCNPSQHVKQMKLRNKHHHHTGQGHGHGHGPKKVEEPSEEDSDENENPDIPAVVVDKEI